jgi:O-antigen/teichoic acid export membrane protein
VLGRISLTVASRLALTVLSLVSSIVTARVLGQSGRGDYFFIVTLSATLVQFANLGLPVTATYDVAREPRRAPSVVANAFWASLVGAGGVGFFVVLAAHVLGELQDTPVSFLLLAACLAPPSLFFMIVANVLTGQERFVEFNVLEAASRAAAVVGIVAAGVIGAGARGFAGAAIATWTVSALVTAAVALRGHRPRLRFDRSLFAAGFRFSTKVYVVTLLGFLVLRGNVFLLRREYGPAELGLYSIAAQFSDVLAIVPQATALVLFPRLVKSTGDRWTATRRATLMTASLMIVACGVTAFAADPVIRLLYGASFAPAASVLRIMLPGVAFLGIANVISQYLTAEGMPRILIGVWFAALLLLGATSLALIPDHAGSGAAAALSITYGSLLVGIVAVAYRHRRGREAPGSSVRFDLEELPPAAE